ncbi:MAG: glycoside hydrolase family 3 N-terminal domain-containing protein [Bacteroidales bacterium]
MKTLLIILLAATTLLMNSCTNGQEAEKDPFIVSLMSDMTIEEKVGQMMQITIDGVTEGDNIYSSYEPVRLDMELLREYLVTYGGGSILNTPNTIAQNRSLWIELINTIQEVATEETRSGIPVIYGIDAIHGSTYIAEATMFPQQIGMAATWNPELVEEGAAITAYETRAAGIPWNFSPVLDLGSDPRWARQWETFGEDPYLTEIMGVAMIDGYEGKDNDISDPYRLASCPKHFYGYGLPFSGKDRTPVYLPEMELRDKHLPPFRAAIDAGAHSIMLNSGLVNNISVHASREIITGLLKEELGFEGLVVTDWADIENLHTRDKIAGSSREAVKIAINAGIDMSMIPYDYKSFHENLVGLVNDGEVPVSRIDDAVYRILRVKKALGLFDNPVVDPEDYPLFAGPAHAMKAYESALESITLLVNKNETLPLSENTRILITGPNANSMRSLNGGWTYSWQGDRTPEFTEDFNTILDAVKITGGENNILYEPGTRYIEDGRYYEEEEVDIQAAVAKARQADVILLCLGENSYTEKPGDLNDLTISPLQEKLARAIAETGKPVILVLNQGRPRLITSFAHKMDAVINIYLPGNYGADALADILYGKVNPSGRLPYTYPKYPNSLVGYIHKPSEVSLTPSGAYDYSGSFNPLFEFGYGMSYSSVEYTGITVDKESLGSGEQLVVSVDISHIDGPPVKEVVKLFSSQLIASTTPDVRRLRAFEKTDLQPGESKTIEFTLELEDLSFINHENRRVTEAGEFIITVADKSAPVIVTEDVYFD